MSYGHYPPYNPQERTSTGRTPGKIRIIVAIIAGLFTILAAVAAAVVKVILPMLLGGLSAPPFPPVIFLINNQGAISVSSGAKIVNLLSDQAAGATDSLQPANGTRLLMIGHKHGHAVYDATYQIRTGEEEVTIITESRAIIHLTQNSIRIDTSRDNIHQIEVWDSTLQQFAPSCVSSSKSVWHQSYPDSMALSCGSAGLSMQQTSRRHIAELDLAQVNSSTYDQTMFRVQVDVTFQNINDLATSAELLVQTPQAPSIGGFSLALKATGDWELVQEGKRSQIVRHGSLHFDPSQPITMEVIVQDGKLSGFIDGQKVVEYTDSLRPSAGTVGLIVQRNQAPSSKVYFSNFELDL